jgi:DNA-binding protein HU-beta
VIRLNKGELVDAVAAALDVSKSQADKTVNAVLGGIEKGLKKDRKVSIVGFGTFEVRKRKARTGRNPRTGEEIKIKAGRSVGFKAGKALKDGM